MSIWTKLFGGDPWREIERKAKASKYVFLQELKDFVRNLAPDLQDLIRDVVMAEIAKRGQK